MGAFRFHLEKVLKWHQTQRDVEELRLKQLNQARADAQAALAHSQASRLATELEVRSLESLGGGDLAALAAYGLRMEKREQQLTRQCESCGVQVQAQQERWLDAQRRCQLLEKLQTRRRAEFTRQRDKDSESLATEIYLALVEQARL